MQEERLPDRYDPVMDAFIFDLDDTLIDTRRILVPDALRRVADAIDVGVERLNDRGKSIGDVLQRLEGLTEEQRARATAEWYSTDVPELPLLPGVEQMLARLRGHARLFLLTRGDPARQLAKIERCGIGAWFEQVIVRPIDEPGSKRNDIERILALCNLPPERCTVVGDDPDDELKHAADLGCVAVLVPATPLPEIGR